MTSTIQAEAGEASIRKRFQVISGGDGLLTVAEMKEGLSSGSFPPSNEAVAKLHAKLDKSGDGNIDEAEFIKIWTDNKWTAQFILDNMTPKDLSCGGHKTETEEEKIRRLFKVIAGDDSVLDPAELKKSLADGGYPPSDGAVASLHARIDSSGDGKVDEKEFIEMWKYNKRTVEFILGSMMKSKKCTK